MSVLFPKVPKPREWDYRPIYFDKEKEARKDKKLARLHHGAFREEHDRTAQKETVQTGLLARATRHAHHRHIYIIIRSKSDRQWMSFICYLTAWPTR